MNNKRYTHKTVLIDPQTGAITYTRSEEIKRKIRQAVIKGSTLDDGTIPSPSFDNEQNKQSFLDDASALIAQFMTERFTFDELLIELNKDVKNAIIKRKSEIERVNFSHRQLGEKTLSEKSIQRIKEKETSCLNVEIKRLPEPLMSLCNPDSAGWRKEENILISKMLVLYKEFTPLKTQRRIYANMAMIFIACGLRTENDYVTLSETLRKRRIKPAIIS
jgi:hypothetical protein